MTGGRHPAPKVRAIHEVKRRPQRSTRATLVTSQYPVTVWHEMIGDATVADGILDRLIHSAHQIELKGESMRKKSRARKKEAD